ncbi:MAG: MMPL family transporter, partial [Cyclobacteriaceae bacterium]
MPQSNKINKTLSNFYTSRRRLKYAFVILLLLVGLSGTFLTKISFDFDFESFFPVGHPDRAVFAEFNERFAYDNDFLLLSFSNEEGIFNRGFLQKVSEITRQIDSLKATVETLSPVSIGLPVKTSMGLSMIKILHPDDQERLAKDSLRIIKNGTFEKNFFSLEDHSLILRIKHQHFDDFRQSEDYISQVQSIITNGGIDDFHLAGRTSVQSEFIRLIQTDFGVFIVIAFAIIILFLKIQYGSWPAVFIPLMLIVATIVTTLGLMTALGYSLNILTVLIPTIISFVAISDVIHFYTKYQVTILEGADRREALLKTVKEIGLATFLTSLTTGIGFISLVTIKVLPVQLLGIFTAVGVFIAFIYTFILLPFFSESLTVKDQRKTIFWQRFSMWCFRFSVANQNSILVAGGLLLAIGITGASLIKIDAYLLDDLPEDSFSRQSFSEIDRKFGGTKPWNLYFYTGDSSTVYDQAVLEELRDVQTYLSDTYGLKNITGPVEETRLIRQSYRGGIASDYKLPDTSEELNQLLSYNTYLAKRQIVIVENDQRNFGKISGFIPEWGSLRTSAKDRELIEYLDNIDSDLLTYKITGTTYLIDRSHEYLSVNLFWGLLFAFCAVAVISVVLFRSFSMIIISLIPNVLPVLLTAAVIGFFNIPIKLTTSIIFAVSFGIAVDDTIHFISKFRFEKTKHSTLDAVRNTFKTAGMAIIKTTVLLCLGFGVF